MSQSRHAHYLGQVVALHSHATHQLLLVESGVLAVTSEYGVWVIGPLRAVWVPAGTAHEVRAHESTVVHTLDFREDLPDTDSGAPRDVVVRPLLRELVLAATEAGLDPAEADRLRAVILDRVTPTDRRGLVLPIARDPRLEDACALVRRDLTQTLTLAEVATRVRSSERTLTRLFHDEFSMTYSQWRTAIRTYEAMLLLTSGTSVTETAHRCGWSTPSAFVDSFRRATGQTPGRFQRAQHTDPMNL